MMKSRFPEAQIMGVPREQEAGNAPAAGSQAGDRDAHRGRLHARGLGGGGRHLDPRPAHGARAECAIARRGKPALIVSDNGTEMTSRAMLEWAAAGR
ncbi:hypothetical protein HZ989_10775 [Brevundimonas sp. AJA228-03]|nr:hypothetical protein HZ989_10775 [Brevundimonas sp. AJA228-03]